MAAEENVETTRFILNGAAVAVTAPPDERLSDSLRERLGARDVKIGCNAGDCGACSVLLDGQVVCACLTPTCKADGRRIETVAGLVATDLVAQALSGRFQDHGAAQCGFCTPGMMVASVALLRQEPEPDETAITRALDTLSRLGFVQRRRDPKDGRNVFVERTEKGDAFLDMLGSTILSGDVIEQRPTLAAVS